MQRAGSFLSPDLGCECKEPGRFSLQTLVANAKSRVVSLYCSEKALSLVRPGVGMALDEGFPDGTLRAPPLAAIAAPSGRRFMAG
jgi:hypothetical protein